MARIHTPQDSGFQLREAAEADAECRADLKVRPVCAGLKRLVEKSVWCCRPSGPYPIQEPEQTLKVCTTCSARAHTAPAAAQSTPPAGRWQASMKFAGVDRRDRVPVALMRPPIIGGGGGCHCRALPAP